MSSITPLVNGIAYSYADINININGVPLFGVSAINYNQTEGKANNYGTGRFATSRGSGKIEAEASMTVERVELNSLVNGAPNKSLLNIAPFDIIVSYINTAGNATTDIIKNCQFTSEGSGGAVDDTSINSELTLICTHIELNKLS